MAVVAERYPHRLADLPKASDNIHVWIKLVNLTIQSATLWGVYGLPMDALLDQDLLLAVLPAFKRRTEVCDCSLHRHGI